MGMCWGGVTPQPEGVDMGSCFFRTIVLFSGALGVFSR